MLLICGPIEKLKILFNSTNSLKRSVLNLGIVSLFPSTKSDIFSNFL